MLGVKADRVDDAVGTHNGGLYRALVMGISDDLFRVVALGPRRMP
jgi:hypothetical protein